jgi:hypothetical protein
MRRLFWVALGATAGVLVVRKLNQVAQSYTPEGLSKQVGSLADALRDVADVVREGMAEREQELRVALGVDAGDLDPAQAQELLDRPTAPRHRG